MAMSERSGGKRDGGRGSGAEGAGGGGRLADALGRFLDQTGLAEGIERQGVLLEWPSAVGDGIARVTTPRSVNGGTLVVEVRSSPWLMELNLMKREILERVNAGRPDAPVERIVFVLAPTP
jgi:predicted nucleic acid-binding Zn ribbon protein